MSTIKTKISKKIRDSNSTSDGVGIVTKTETKEVGQDDAAKRFVSDLQVRGEAAKLTSDGELPLSATHALTQSDEDGTIKEVKRARFKAF